MAKKEKIAVQPGQSADFKMQRLRNPRSQAVLIGGRKMVMTDVRRISEHEVEPLLWRMLAREVAFHDRQAAGAPECRCSFRKQRIKLDTRCGRNLLWRKGLAKSRVE